MVLTRGYTASKTREAGRQRYSVIYRHPVRIDPSTGKVGRRVRRGLGTSTESDADRLVAELNELLSAEAYWSLSARATAEARFDPTVVSIFFDGMEPEAETSASVRDSVIPLPTSDDGYKRVLLLGTTGAGKTTVLRQLLGTDPVRDRFPSTSAAKTTIADTEIVISQDQPSFRAVVTFSSRDEVIDHLTDCASKAALASLNGASESDIRHLLLDHENQRFRFSYVLGRREDTEEEVKEFGDCDDDDDSEPPGFDAEPDVLPGIDVEETSRLIDTSIKTLRELALELEGEVRGALVVHKDDERIAREILEEDLDQLLRSNERFNRVVDALLDEVDRRFVALQIGTVVRDRQGWPKAWRWESDDRIQFLKAVNRFCSNYAPLFGQLLSPLVNGIRVAGAFGPEWLDGGPPRLVLIDGEGLGHTSKSAAVVPTAVAKAVEAVDAVLLVDNAAQPMQAAPAMAIRSILTSGNIEKLLFCFTHFDEVHGDNLTTRSARARHVLASCRNLLASFREEFHVRAAKAVERRLKDYRFFLANAHQRLDVSDQNGRQMVAQLKKLIVALQNTGRPESGAARPRYDKTNLILAVTEAVTSFHRRWRALLGTTYDRHVAKEHWTRIRALNRRFAEGTDDYYDTLRPSSELRESLKDEIYRTLESPLGWSGQRPNEESEITSVIDAFSSAIAKRLYVPISERLSERPIRTWQEAYALHGVGSTFVRARTIAADILARTVPVPGATPSPDQNEFLHAIIDTIESAADEQGIDLR